MPFKSRDVNLLVEYESPVEPSQGICIKPVTEPNLTKPYVFNQHKLVTKGDFGQLSHIFLININ